MTQKTEKPMPDVKLWNWNKLYDLFEERGLRKSSRETAKSQIRRVLSGVYGNNPITLAEIKKNSPTKVLDWLKDESNGLSYSTRKNLMGSMYKFFEAVGVKSQAFNDEYKRIQELSTAERAGGLSNKQSERFNKADFDEIKDKANKAKDPTNKLMLTLYAGYMPPLRSNEWRDLKVITTKKYVKSQQPENYAVLPEFKLVIRDSKTSDHYDAKVVKLPTEVVEAIKEYLASVGGNTLFKGMSGPSFSKRLTRQLGYSVQTLRKRYVSEKVAEGISPEDRVELARVMGHSLNTSQLDYNKELNKESDEDEE